MVDHLPKYVLDTFALLAYFQAEPGGSQVRDLIEKAQRDEIILFMSLINLGEMYYVTYKKLGKPIADTMVQDTYTLPITIQSVTDTHVWDAAELKGQYQLSYADAFGASLAKTLQAFFVTGDPEIKPLEASNALKVMWL
ncbi:MAG: type II toxin-antitoxin system VapC family toxin [Anaerolineaceae bacterium]